MSGKILINYEAVYTKCRELRNRLLHEIRDMDGEYRHIQSNLQRMDSRTNAELMTTIAANQGKAQVTADTLQRLLTTIENSARATEQEELRIKQAFDMMRPSNSMPRAGVSSIRVAGASGAPVSSSAQEGGTN